MDSRVALAVGFNGVLLLTCGFALWRGGRPERVGAIANLAGCIITAIVRLIIPSAWAPGHYLVASIDLGVMGTFYFLATHSTRFWPIWAFGFALADVLLSIAGTLLPYSMLLAFHSGTSIYAYLALAALVLGTSRLPRDASPEQRRGSRLPWLREAES